MAAPLHRSTRVVIPGLTAVLIALTISGCSPKASEAVVASVGKQDITLPDYERMFVKSNGSREAGEKASMEEREKFLDLMIKYRLKLADAYRVGMEKRPEVVGELQQYKGNLAESFLTDREVVQPGVKDFYARRSEEIRASHILLELSPTASPADSAEAYARAYEVIAKAKSGTDFSTLATQLSKDPSANRNGGDLYYFTAGQMVPAFENAAYAMKVGEISSVPVRTQYGLHIIKVTDRHPAPGEVRSGHIMIRFPSQNPSPEDTAAAYAKSRALRDSLMSGADFAGLATRNSEDPGSAPKGGDLGWFTRRRWILPFDEVAMAMKPGETSNIVRTVYGYHRQAHTVMPTTARRPQDGRLGQVERVGGELGMGRPPADAEEVQPGHDERRGHHGDVQDDAKDPRGEVVRLGWRRTTRQPLSHSAGPNAFQRPKRDSFTRFPADVGQVYRDRGKGAPAGRSCFRRDSVDRVQAPGVDAAE